MVPKNVACPLSLTPQEAISAANRLIATDIPAIDIWLASAPAVNAGRQW